MVLKHHQIEVSEEKLLTSVEPDYGKGFHNIWNPTIAKLAREYDVDTTMYAEWPLFKPELLKQAMAEYTAAPESFNVAKYEDPDDDDVFPEPLPLAYKEMFEAIRLGCDVEYGSLTKKLLTKVLDAGALIQTSVKLQRLYDDGKKGYHSILIYAYDDATVHYHDPYRGPALTANMGHLINASADTGAAMVYR
jgi:hypothetical protein